MATKGTTTQRTKSRKRQVPIREGLFHLPTSPHQKPHLIGSRCRFCSYVAFPKRVICPACVREDPMEETPLSTRGRVYSFTVAHVAPPGFVAPYLQAFIDLPEGPRIFSLISGVEPTPDAMENGMKVELVIEKIRDNEKGEEVIGYKFRPIKGE